MRVRVKRSVEAYDLPFETARTESGEWLLRGSNRSIHGAERARDADTVALPDERTSRSERCQNPTTAKRDRGPSMAIEQELEKSDTEHMGLCLDSLLAERGLKRYGLFAVSGEGTVTRTAMKRPAATHCPIEIGQALFWTGWDEAAQRTTFDMWKPTEPQAKWEERQGVPGGTEGGRSRLDSEGSIADAPA